MKKKTRKQERKGNRIITIDGENSKKVELQHWSQKTLRKQNHQPPKPQSGSTWKTYWLSAMILHSQFNLISISVSKTRAILLLKIKIKLIEMFEPHERMQGMRSTKYQVTIPLEFFIIIHNYANV